MLYVFVSTHIYIFLEEAKKFEDGLQEAKDFFNIQRKHVCMYVCMHILVFQFFVASLEVSQKCCSLLLHVENHRQISDTSEAIEAYNWLIPYISVLISVPYTRTHNRSDTA